MAKKRSERGQITVFLGVIITTFILFFMFVVNIGMLVHAKINIQNAADMAAYAGAATQARLLNQIGFLNYEMRRHYKKFLFRYHLIGNMAQKSHSQSGSGQRIWTPTGDPNDNFGVPAVCIIFNSQDNFCQLSRSPKIEGVSTATSVFDGITSALNQQLRNLEQMRLLKCLDIGKTNQIVTALWLFNADPNLQSLQQQMQGADAETAAMIRTAQGLSQGLGLIPRLQILLHRIKTLEYYINFPPQKGMTPSVAAEFPSTGDPGARERTSVAFNSAFNTLGPNLFKGENGDYEHITMDELLPEGGTDGRANLISLEPINIDFDAYYFEPTIDSTISDPQDCVSIPVPMKVRAMTVGVFKRPTTLTYYAVRLKAQARLLFSPFGRVTLKAYAAAMPFGSRIGPKASPEDFLKAGAKPINVPAAILCTDCPGTPNVAVRDGDSSDQGWWMNDVISEYFAFLRAPTEAGIPTTSADLQRAYDAAMAPNPAEKGQYLIPHDLNASESDEFNREFGNPFVRFFDQDHIMAFWAPVVSPDLNTNVAEAIRETMEASLSQSNQLADPDKLDAFTQSIDRYISQLRSGTTGEDGESFSVAKIRDPLVARSSTNPGEFEQISIGKGILMRTAEDFKTHWNDIKDGDLEARGRIGYSVKFVSLRSLIDKTITADGSEAFTNDLPTSLDSESEADLQFIKH